MFTPDQANFLYVCNRVYCIHVPGHDPLIFSCLSFILFDWVVVLWPQLSKVLKRVSTKYEVIMVLNVH